MKERPILFSAPMVRAILAGNKTQTRRVIKQATGLSLSVGMADDAPGVAELSWLWGDGPGHEVHETIKRVSSPYGQPGDRLWVRETWRPIQPGGPCIYLATDGDGRYPPGPLRLFKWRPSIHMPRWASRITLEVTGVRVERLQEISAADAVAEGAPPSHPSIDKVSREFGYKDFPRSWYAQLWDDINGPGSWDLNPWVWVVEFQRLKP